MIRWITSPKLVEVAKYVECYWFISKTLNDGEARPKLNPDPSAHLIISPAQQRYSYKSDEISFQGNGCHWLYPHSKTLELDHSNDVLHIGVKFKVGALYSIQQVNFKQNLLDTVEAWDLKGLCCDASIDGDILIASTVEVEKCTDLLDKLLLQWLKSSVEDKHSELIRKVLALKGDNPINKLGEFLFCSQRTLERSFLKVTGLTLKQYQSMNKLEAILEYLYQRQQADIDWVDIAYQFGFSDQPHLIRYLKNQIGLTPKNYVLERGFTIDVYGGVDSK